MVQPYFENIRKQIINELEIASSDIKVAICWFTCKELFDVLCNKLRNNKSVSLIVLNDSINNRPDGLNFQNFIDLGGNFYYSDVENPMHNKYCIIDNTTLINGSYNWTYFAENKNFENITIFKDDSVVNDFINDFSRLEQHCNLVKDVSKEANKDSKITIIENAILAEETDLILKNKKEIDSNNLILKHTIGESIHNDKYIIFLKKGSKIPNKFTHNLTTVEDYQTTCKNDIRFGEEDKGSSNTKIGEFSVKEIPPLPKGEPGLITTFSIDEYGILTVSVKVLETGIITIQKFNIENLIE